MFKIDPKKSKISKVTEIHEAEATEDATTNGVTNGHSSEGGADADAKK